MNLDMKKWFHSTSLSFSIHDFVKTFSREAVAPPKNKPEHNIFFTFWMEETNKHSSQISQQFKQAENLILEIFIPGNSCRSHGSALDEWFKMISHSFIWWMSANIEICHVSNHLNWDFDNDDYYKWQIDFLISSNSPLWFHDMIFWGIFCFRRILFNNGKGFVGS